MPFDISYTVLLLYNMNTRVSMYCTTYIAYYSQFDLYPNPECNMVIKSSNFETVRSQKAADKQKGPQIHKRTARTNKNTF